MEQKNHKQERTQRQKAEEQLKLSMEMCHKLEVTERERDRLKALLTSLQQNQQSDSTTTFAEELKSERLQLQVELENLRNSMNREMESVRGACEKERNELKQKNGNFRTGKESNVKINRGNDFTVKYQVTCICTCTCHHCSINPHVQLNMQLHVHVHVIILCVKNLRYKFLTL